MSDIFKVQGHHKLPKQLQCTLALIFQVSVTLLLGLTPFLQKDIPSFDVDGKEHQSKIIST